jgi:Flp pilus assembly protein TadG
MAMLIRLSRLCAAVRRAASCRNGNTAVEFSMSAPVVILLAVGALDYGSAYVESVRLNGAARAGTQQALYNSHSWQDTDGMEQAALEEYVGHALTPEQVAAMSVSAVAEAFCACTAGATLACSGTCPGGATPGQFVRLSMSRAMPLRLPYPWADSDAVTVNGAAVVRVH